MKKRKRGRQPFEPTQAQRDFVKMASTLGIAEERMVKGVINPRTGKSIAPKTLRLYFRPELDRGMLEADVEAGQNLLALTKKFPAAAIFWAKVRLHMKETATFELPVAPVNEDEEPENLRDTARRIAYTLVMGARQDQPRKAK